MLPLLDHAIALESLAPSDAPFTLSGARCVVRGCERRGVTAVQVDDERDVAELRVENGVCTAFRITPLGIERHLRIGPATVVEKTVVAPTDAALAIEWITDADTELVLACRHAPEVTAAFTPAAQPPRIALARSQAMLVTITAGEAGAARPDPAAWVRIHTTAAQRRSGEWLGVSLPAQDVNLAFEWARFRVATGAGPLAQQLRSLIALGEVGTTRAALAAMPPDRDFLALLGAYFAASGDDRFLRAQWPRALAARAAAEDIAEPILRELAYAAEAIGESASAATLRLRTQRRDRESCAWTDFAAGRTQAAVRGWLDLARCCYERELGAWPVTVGRSAGDVVSAFVYGLLGFEPDGARGRLRLRPQMPEGWPDVRIHNIRLGDAAITLTYARLPGGRRFDVAQTAGAFPLRLIFEPAVPTLPAEAVVDGQTAQLNYTPFGERIVAPVQLILDAPRTIELHD